MNRLSHVHYLKSVKVGAWYDLAAAAAFATPWSFELVYTLMRFAAQQLGFSGSLPDMQPIQVMFANMMGTVVVLWAVVRIRHPSVEFGRLDGAARVLFSAWMIYALAHGASMILLVFLLPELVFALLHAWPVAATVQANVAAERL